MKTLALDIGGANIKAAVKENSRIKEFSIYFPLWRKKELLERTLREIVKNTGTPERTLLTMTGELCDCYSNKEEGVRHILYCVENVVPNFLVLSNQEKLIPPEEARKNPYRVASANWISTSLFIARKFKTGILIDIGSTTTDIIPVMNGKIISSGRTDLERLKPGELIYTGILRTNVATLSKEVPVNSSSARISSELFSITADVYRILGDISQEEYACDTPDGRGKSVEECMSRLVRVLCCDMNELSREKIRKIARVLKEKQIEEISLELSKISKRTGIKNAFICGSGRFLGKGIAEKTGIQSLKEIDINPAKAMLFL